MKTITNFLISIMLIATASCQEARTVKVTVTEEDGNPIKGASTTVIFLGYGHDGKKEKVGLTDLLGEFEAKGTTSGRMHVRVEKDGYYTTNSGRLSRKKDHDVSYVLRKVKNPIAMFAKRLYKSSPVLEKEYGYDFMKGDWVKPYGKGEISDLLFTANILRKVDKYNDYHIKKTMRFSNENDGFIKYKQTKHSDFKSVHEAPLVGDYKKVWVYSREKKPNETIITNSDKSSCYIFRIRTKVDAVGNVVSCHYAKAYGDFPDLNIYFNPLPNDRNLEFDPTKNMFKNLESIEKVRKP